MVTNDDYGSNIHDNSGSDGGSNVMILELL